MATPFSGSLLNNEADSNSLYWAQMSQGPNISGPKSLLKYG